MPEVVVLWADLSKKFYNLCKETGVSRVLRAGIPWYHSGDILVQ
jgi:hypothetical protein